MKILFITNMYPSETEPVSGIFVKEQIDEIAKAIDCEHDLFVIDGKQNGKLEYLKSILKIPRQIKKHQYDIIHIHYGLSALFLLFYKPKAKVYLSLHGSDILKEAGNYVQVFLTRKILGKVDKVFILNEKMADVVRPLNPNYEMLPCGVNTNLFKPNGAAGRRGTQKIIVFPSSPARVVKNYALFERTIKYVSQNSDFEFTVKCIDQLTRQEVRDLLNAADCLLMTSKSEGSPQVIKEALCCGTSVVSVPVGDVISMLAGVPHCYVSKAMDDPKELGQLVLESIRGKCDANAIRRAFIKKGKYDQSSITQRLISNYT